MSINFYYMDLWIHSYFFKGHMDCFHKKILKNPLIDVHKFLWVFNSTALVLKNIKSQVTTTFYRGLRNES
jgi:hypothetical protein